MDATAIITLSDVYEYLSVSGSDDGPLIQKLIDRKTVEFENWCGLDSFYVYDYTEYYDGDGSPYLFVKNFPINSISLVADDSDWSWGSDTTADLSDFRIVEKNHIVYNSYFNEGLQNIKITYNAGYSVIPFDIQEVMCEEVTRIYNRRKEVDIFIKTITDGSQHRYNKALLPTTMLILSKYRRVRAF